MANFVNIRIDPELHKRVMIYCREHGVTLTALITDLLKTAISKGGTDGRDGS